MPEVNELVCDFLQIWNLKYIYMYVCMYMYIHLKKTKVVFVVLGFFKVKGCFKLIREEL